MVNLLPVDMNDEEARREFFEFIVANYPKTAHPLKEGDLISSSKHFFWAQLNGERVGTAGYQVKTPTLCETTKTVVSPDHQGKGLGKEISKAIEEKVRAEGFKKVTSTIYTHNHKMIAIKLSQGYTVEGLHHDHEAPGWHEYSLGKSL